ncbi:hypothetical protein RRG08_030525 [Elysia crispata]|uniref:Uncharacterized protein n=1 Tax=Elysia crispata TaxID=231223 RepID=A0AAE0YMH3_9GAST|nr:hypothetical protein RRG08_030525 [Elysia crispata]
MEKDTQKLWQLTKALNDDSVFRSQTVLLTESRPAAGKAACNVLANAYKNRGVARLQLDGEKIEIPDKPTFLGVTLDPRLTWKPHLETVENKSIRRLSLMKKLARTKWGAILKIQRQVYTGNIIPVADYASSSWSTSSKANKTE